MHVEEIILGLEKNITVFQALFNLNAEGLILYKPTNKSWCFLEVACHLVDEEVEDFRARVALALFTPNNPLKPISPETWPKERNYLKKDYDLIVSQFLFERKKSVDWLKQLKKVNWSNFIEHPDLGALTAEQFLVNWLAHDYHHIRQLNALKHAYLKSISGDDLTYAGKW